LKKAKQKHPLDKAEQQISSVSVKETSVRSETKEGGLTAIDEGQIERRLESLEVYISHHESFSGYMPHPKHLAMYEEILPGFAERALSMAEKSQDGFLDDIKAERRIETTSLYFGFASFIILVTCSMITLSLGYGVEAAALFLTAIVFGVIRLFVERRGQKINTEENKS